MASTCLATQASLPATRCPQSGLQVCSPLAHVCCPVLLHAYLLHFVSTALPDRNKSLVRPAVVDSSDSESGNVSADQEEGGGSDAGNGNGNASNGGYSDDSDAFDAESGSPSPLRKAARLVASPKSRVAVPNGTLYEMRVQVHAVHNLLLHPMQTCRIVFELFGMVISIESGQGGAAAGGDGQDSSDSKASAHGESTDSGSGGGGASGSLEESEDVFASLGLAGAAGPRVATKAVAASAAEGGSDKLGLPPAPLMSRVFVFDSGGVRRFLANERGTRAFFGSEGALLLEIIVKTPPGVKVGKQASSPHRRQSSFRSTTTGGDRGADSKDDSTGVDDWGIDGLGGLSDDASSSSDDSQPAETLDRFMCEVPLATLLDSHEVSGPFRITRTDGSRVRTCRACLNVRQLCGVE